MRSCMRRPYTYARSSLPVLFCSVTCSRLIFFPPLCDFLIVVIVVVYVIFFSCLSIFHHFCFRCCVWAVFVLVVDVWALPLPIPLPRVVIQYMYSMAIIFMIVVCVPIDDLLVHC